jgi:hypothetical protein
MRVSGNRGAREILNPPNPHPTSANSTFFPFRLREPVPGSVGGSKKVGKWVDQSIVEGDEGLGRTGLAVDRNVERRELTIRGGEY